jgi:hypothetical protein
MDTELALYFSAGYFYSLDAIQGVAALFVGIIHTRKFLEELNSQLAIWRTFPARSYRGIESKMRRMSLESKPVSC